jgi:parallel beta-helix repeat protein
MLRETVSYFLLFLFVVSMVALLPMTRSVNASPIAVTVPDDYPSIQAAINAANDVDVIFVRNGTYNENVVVNKSISLVGENRNGTFIDSIGIGGNVVSITASHVNVSGFTMQHSGSWYSGIYLDRVVGCVISDNILVNDFFGLYASESSQNIIRGNIVQFNSLRGIHLESSTNNTIVENDASLNSNQGIFLESSNSNSILRNNASYDEDGIYLWGSSNNLVQDNLAVSNPSNGIYVRGYDNGQTDNNTILGNELNNSNSAILVDCAANTLLSHNRINMMTGGIFIADFSNNTIVSDNSITNSEFGIGLHFFLNHTILFGNNISSNTCGLYVSEFPNNDIVYHNNFINNVKQVEMEPDSLDPSFDPWLIRAMNSSWDNGYPSGGNYWSDYNGTDVYSGVYQNETGIDGIGDAPYVIDGNNTDRYPLTKPYVALLGDVNGDRKVDLKDVCAAVQAFNSFPGQPRWNTDADVDHSGRVDMRDIVMIVLNFNHHE